MSCLSIKEEEEEEEYSLVPSKVRAMGACHPNSGDAGGAWKPASRTGLLYIDDEELRREVDSKLSSMSRRGAACTCSSSAHHSPLGAGSHIAGTPPWLEEKGGRRAVHRTFFL